MAEIRLERIFPVSQDKLFRFVSGAQELVQWFGPEGVSVPVNELDFTRKGPWHAEFTNESGPFAKVSGHVTHVDPPNSVGFTWAWHDENHERGPESFVTFTVTATEGGALLVIDHRELSDEEAATNHRRGWASSIECLAEALVQ